ncbi:MAG TPA: heterodisulfide reductase-related iron-sulfur binding cluster [Vicinamibacterales bacterium]|nr:heterodisulfide reductase-related iron-sulfur binding cluster [Vicinamibacterales bacterium]
MSTEQLSTDTPDSPSSALIDKCVHCGFCLPTCPTYLLWGEEMDSPRGRIYLMKAGIEGRAEMTPSYVQHFDACLGCLACVTACPSGVQYAPLIEGARAQIERTFDRRAGDSLFRRLLLTIVPYPSRMRIAMLPLLVLGPLLRRLAARSARPAGTPVGRPRDTGGGLFARLAAALAVAPPVSWRSMVDRLPERTPAAGSERLRVALLAGCVQRLSFGHVNRATIRVLAAEGCRVDVPGGQGCCGALPLHAGQSEQARALARRNIELFEAAGVDRIVVNAAGCGSAMKEYGQLFANDPAWAERARVMSSKVRDVSEVLAELGDVRAIRRPLPARVVYHDACHLAHGQGVRSQPRDLLRAIPGVELLVPEEAEICCGSAGIYNLVQPEPAAQLGARKVRHIAKLTPDMIATANPGCTLQIAAAARGLGYDWPIFHPIELVDASIHGVDPRTRR